MGKRTWTVEQEDLLKKYYPYASKKTLAKQFPNRSFQSLTDKANEFGLQRLYCSRGDINTSKLVEGKASAFEIGYVAGFIDGEGSISIVSPGKRIKNMHPDPYITIANTNEEVIDFIIGIIGGCKYIQKRKWKSMLGNKTLYYAKIASIRLIYRTLVRLEKFLIVKKKNAKIVKEFCRVRLLRPWFGGIIKEELKLLADIKKLNQGSSE